MWTEAYKYYMEDPKIIKLTKDNCELFCASNDSQIISKQYCKDYLNSLCLDQIDFDSFIKYITSLHVISIKSQEWKNSCFNCLFWEKKLHLQTHHYSCF